MFHGSIPSDMQRIVKELVSLWKCDSIYIGCSGNFTVERVIAELGRFALHSNDVSVYSYGIGRLMEGASHEITLNEALDGHLDWMLPYLNDPPSVAASIKLASRLVPYLDKDAMPKEDNGYNAKMYAAFKKNFPDLHASTREKYVYASMGPIRIVMPQQDIEPYNVPRIDNETVITANSKLTLHTLNYKQFQGLRSQYMNIHIRPGSASQMIAVHCDGKLIGVFALSVAPSVGSEISTVYLLSDFPVSPTRYKDLAKLVLYAALSKESKLIAERTSNRRARWLFTTAFTSRPSSMKYRGLFNLHSRKDNPTKSADWGKDIDADSDPYYGNKYMINYNAPLGQWSLAEGMKKWSKKHGNKVRW